MDLKLKCSQDINIHRETIDIRLQVRNRFDAKCNDQYMIHVPICPTRLTTPTPNTHSPPLSARPKEAGENLQGPLPSNLIHKSLKASPQSFI